MAVIPAVQQLKIRSDVTANDWFDLPFYVSGKKLMSGTGSGKSVSECIHDLRYADDDPCSLRWRGHHRQVRPGTRRLGMNCQDQWRCFRRHESERQYCHCEQLVTMPACFAGSPEAFRFAERVL